MFGLLKKRVEVLANPLWLINLHLARGTNAEMPANLVGAYVPAYTFASDHEAAGHKVVAHIRDLGYKFLDILDGKIHQLDPMKWDSYVAEAWPEFVDHFPSQDEVLGWHSSSKVFFGPFAGYEEQKAQPNNPADA